MNTCELCTCIELLIPCSKFAMTFSRMLSCCVGVKSQENLYESPRPSITIANSPNSIHTAVSAMFLKQWNLVVISRVAQIGWS